MNFILRKLKLNAQRFDKVEVNENSKSRTISDSFFPCHSWFTSKIDFWFPRHFWVPLILSFDCFNTCKTNYSHVMSQASRFSKSSFRNTSQKTRNDIVKVSFIEFKLAILISLLTFLLMIVSVALVSLWRLKNMNWVAEARTDRFSVHIDKMHFEKVKDVLNAEI